MGKSLKELVKGTSILGGARIVEFVVGLIKVKVSALILGVSGIGVFNQANFLSQKLSNFTLLSTGEALVKQLAESSDKDEARMLILAAIKGYIVLVSVFMCASILLLWVFAEQLTGYVFGDDKYLYVFWVCLSGLPLLVANSIPYSLMRAFQDVSSMALVRVLAVVVNLFHTVPLIYCYGLAGAVGSIFLCHLVTVTLNYIYARKLYFKRFNISLKDCFRSDVNPKYMSELLQFSGFGVTIGVYVIVSEFVCRSIVVKNLGVEAIGLYSPVIMWATLFTGFLLPALTTYLFSSLCKAEKSEDISIILNNGIRLASFALMPLLFLAIPFKELIIVVFYSGEFLDAAKYLPFHLLGVAFHVWFSVLGKSMGSTGRIRQHGVFRFMFLTVDIVVTYYAVSYWGLWGWTAKHMVSPVVFFFVYSAYCYRFMGFRLSSKNIFVMVYVFLGGCVLILINEGFAVGYIVNYAGGPLALLGGFAVLDLKERAYFKSKAMSLLHRRNVRNG